jgi:hypothetical protein
VGLDPKGLRHGTHRQPCPRCSSKRRKSRIECLAVTIGQGGAKWYCHHCAWRGYEPWQAGARFEQRTDIEAPIPPEVADEYIGPHYNTPRVNFEDAVWAAANGFDAGDLHTLKRVADAWSEWEQAKPVAGSLAETYIRARVPELAADFPFNHEAIRFEPQAWHPYANRSFPALLAKVIRARTAQFCGVQRIYLLADASNRLPDDQQGRLSLGKLVRGVVKLSPQRCDDGHLVLIEGVVKGLAAVDCGIPGVICATLGKTNMRHFPHLPSVTLLTIVPDNDADGRTAAHDLPRRYRWRGTAVRRCPPPSGKDLDGYLRGDA